MESRLGPLGWPLPENLSPSTAMAKQRVLVIGAHPDDEVLGLGGTLARHICEGDEVHAFILCEGMSLRYPEATHDFLVKEAEASAAVLGLTSVEINGFPDQGLDRHSLVDIIKPIDARIQKYQPTIVYTHSVTDINRDHKITYEATLVAARSKATSIQELYAYETPSETEYGIPYAFSPNHFVEIGRYLDKKLEAMACYKSQLQDSPGPRSIEHLRLRAHYWGQPMLMTAAEPFLLLRSYRR